jgi:hypothetical protein
MAPWRRLRRHWRREDRLLIIGHAKGRDCVEEGKKDLTV